MSVIAVTSSGILVWVKNLKLWDRHTANFVVEVSNDGNCEVVKDRYYKHGPVSQEEMLNRLIIHLDATHRTK